MRVLLLSDIHANEVALEAVLAAAGDVAATVCLGDLVGYGPNPNEVIERVRDLAPIACLAGNHDLAALGSVSVDMFNTEAAKAARWTGEQLTPENRAWLEALLPEGRVADAHLAHASPRDPVWEYLELPEQGPPNFESFDGHLCFVGHTHVPRLFEHTNGRRFTPAHALAEDAAIVLRRDVRMILNPGSVGQPRDGDWRAAFAIWNLEMATFELHRVEYEVEETQRRIEHAGLPPVLGYRLTLGR